MTVNNSSHPDSLDVSLDRSADKRSLSSIRTGDPRLDRSRVAKPERARFVLERGYLRRRLGSGGPADVRSPKHSLRARKALVGEGVIIEHLEVLVENLINE